MMTKGDRKKLSMTDQAHLWNDGVQLPPSLLRARCDPCTELGHTPRRTEFPILSRFWKVAQLEPTWPHMQVGGA